MRFGLPQHLIAYVVVNAGLFALNLAPVGFELHRPGVPLWFVYPLAGWGVLLVAHGVLVGMGVRFQRAGAPPPAAPRPAVTRASLDPAKAGRTGLLLAECRTRAGGVLSALAARGGVPVDIDDLLRGAISQAEHLAARLTPVHHGSDPGEPSHGGSPGPLEAQLEALHIALEVLRLEAVVLQESEADPLVALAGPLEQLREAILGAAESLGSLD